MLCKTKEKQNVIKREILGGKSYTCSEKIRWVNVTAMVKRQIIEEIERYNVY